VVGCVVMVLIILFPFVSGSTAGSTATPYVATKGLSGPAVPKNEEILFKKHTVFALTSQRENYINEPGAELKVGSAAKKRLESPFNGAEKVVEFVEFHPSGQGILAAQAAH